MKGLTMHPISIIKEILAHANAGNNVYLEFSKYVGGGHDKTITRSTFTLKYPELTEDWLEDQLLTLKSNEELALHSRVYFVEKKDVILYQLPLIDFYKASDDLDLGSIVSRIQKNPSLKDCSVTFFSSGRSLHGYVKKLLPREDWYKFLGTLLLTNPYDQMTYPNVDARWVGHSLENGFSALRISNNTKEYLQPPTFYKEISIEEQQEFVEF